MLGFELGYCIWVLRLRCICFGKWPVHRGFAVDLDGAHEYEMPAAGSHGGTRQGQSGRGIEPAVFRKRISGGIGHHVHPCRQVHHGVHAVDQSGGILVQVMADELAARVLRPGRVGGMPGTGAHSAAGIEQDGHERIANHAGRAGDQYSGSCGQTGLRQTVRLT